MTLKYPPTRLTASFISKLAWQGKVTIVRDTKVTGLMVTVHKTCKSYKVQKDLWTGKRGMKRLVKTVRYTLGTTDEMSLEEARDKAIEVIAQIKQGIDPNESYRAMHTDTWTVEQMYQEYWEDMQARDLSDRTIADMKRRLSKYMGKWKNIPITEIKRSMTREHHKHLTKKHGPYVANQCMRDFRACYNFSVKVADDPDILPSNPVASVTFNKERKSGRVIMPDELPEWWQTLQTQVPNPMRQRMHMLGLLSGLRPTALVTLKRAWVKLDEKAISLPRMKSGRSFDLPLSGTMVQLVREAMQYADVMFPGSEYLFPTRKRNGEISHVQVWKEKALPSYTGHILRHTYRTIAQRCGINITDARLLMDHKVPGIDGVYIHERALFDRLLETQEQMSAAILRLCEADGGRKGLPSD